MQITKKAWMQYTGKLYQIDKKAAEEAARYVSSLGGIEGHMDEVISYAYGLATKYGEAAAAAACEMYDAVAAAQKAGVAAAEPAATATYGETAKAVRGAAKQSEKVVPQAVSRLVKQAGADTVLRNAERDGAQFAWIPMGDTCAFCLTLASRGWQYMSKKALKGGHAEHIHANCDCQYAVRFDGKSTVEGYDPEALLEKYYSFDGTPDEKINAWRREIEGTKRISLPSSKKNGIVISKQMPSDKYIMPESKIKDFLLKPGAKHAQEFFDVGYLPEDADLLNRDIDSQFDETKAFDKRILEDGTERFSIRMMLGKDKEKPFRTVWQRDNPNDKPRFITGHREDD